MNISTWCKRFIIVACLFSLVACQNLGGLNRKQVKVLQSQGFILTDEGWALRLPEKLLFAVNESSIQPETFNKIAELAQRLNRVGISKLKVNGYTDNTGSTSYNDQLSLERAQSVSKALIAGGTQAANMSIRGLGAQHPVADNNTPEGRAENRRVTLIVIP